MTSTSEQPSIQQVTIEPPLPQTKTIIVTAQPPLIPNENATAYCLTRRNVFDAIIALILAAGIIYIVIYWRQSKPFTALTRTMGTTSGLGIRSVRQPTGFGTGADASGIGQLAGGIKKFLRKIFK